MNNQPNIEKIIYKSEVNYKMLNDEIHLLVNHENIVNLSIYYDSEKTIAFEFTLRNISFTEQAKELTLPFFNLVLFCGFRKNSSFLTVQPPTLSYVTTKLENPSFLGHARQEHTLIICRASYLIDNNYKERIQRTLQKELQSIFKQTDFIAEESNRLIEQFEYCAAHHNEVTKFMLLYNLLLQVSDDSQHQVDRKILSISPNIEQTKSPKKASYETLYTRLRNELSHNRQKNYIETEREIIEHVSSFTELVKTVIYDKIYESIYR